MNERFLDIDELERGLAPFRPHSQRWRSLQLRISFFAAILFDTGLESVSTPNLKDMGLFVEPYARGGGLEVPNLDHHPLRHLVLSGISTYWVTVTGLKELQSLMITDLADGLGCPSRDQIAGILLGLPEPDSRSGPCPISKATRRTSAASLQYRQLSTCQP